MSQATQMETTRSFMVVFGYKQEEVKYRGKYCSVNAYFLSAFSDLRKLLLENPLET